MNKLITLTIGIIIGAVLSWGYFVYLPSKVGSIHQVKSIKNHHPKENDNSETSLLVYLSGNSGHVKEVLCQFAPGTIVTLQGLKKIKIKGASQQYAFGVTGYYCEPYK